MAESLLRFHPVEQLEWELPHHHLTASDSELWLEAVHLGPDYWQGAANTWSLVLRGHGWLARLHFACDGPLVELHDQTVPNYWQEVPSTDKTRR